MGIFKAVGSYMKACDDRIGLMSEMLHTTGAVAGLERGRCNEQDFRAMTHKCLRCSSAENCKTWLTDAETGTPAPGFCPNAGQFRQLQSR